MKKKKKLIKVVVILLVIAIVSGAVFVWRSHKAKTAAAAATAENTATVEKEASAPSCLLPVRWKQRILTALLPWWKVK